MGYSFRLAARVLLYASSHRLDNTYHGLCYTSRGALAGMRNSSMGPPHEGSIRRPIAPWANTYHGATSRSCRPKCRISEHRNLWPSIKTLLSDSCQRLKNTPNHCNKWRVWFQNAINSFSLFWEKLLFLLWRSDSSKNNFFCFNLY